MTRINRPLAFALLSFALLFVAADAHAQKRSAKKSPASTPAATVCMSMTAPSYRSEVMDSLGLLYNNGHGDKTCVFPMDKGAEYDEGWMSFVYGLAGLDAAEGMTSLFVYAYFSKDGHVDHLYYNAEGVDQAKFQAAAAEYSSAFRFPLKAPARFKQCTSVEFQRKAAGE